MIFNKTIIPLVLVGYEMIIANSYPTRTRGIIVKYDISERKINFFSGSHLAPKYFKVVANSKKLVAIMTYTKKKTQ